MAIAQPQPGEAFPAREPRINVSDGHGRGHHGDIDRDRVLVAGQSRIGIEPVQLHPGLEASDRLLPVADRTGKGQHSGGWQRGGPHPQQRGGRRLHGVRQVQHPAAQQGGELDRVVELAQHPQQVAPGALVAREHRNWLRGAGPVSERQRVLGPGRPGGR